MHGTFKAIETKIDPLTLESLIAWLEKQPQNMTYNFSNCQGRCLLGRYMASIGMEWSMYHYERLAHRFCPHVPHGFFPIGSDLPHTFGAALERARMELSLIGN